MKLGALIAARDITKGEYIVLNPYPATAVEKLRRAKKNRPYEERREIDRLAEVAYEHAIRN